MPSIDDKLLALARRIDPERAATLGRELPAGAGHAVGALLGTAFPPLAPVSDWQLDALRRLATEGWRVAHQRGDMMTRLLGALGDLRRSELALASLRRGVWAEKARIALRELLSVPLGGAGIDVTARELSDLADAATEVALAEAQSSVEGRFGVPLRSDGRRSSLVVIGLGKLGGWELNAGSDIDVMFVYDTDDGGSATSLHDHWVRVARRAVSTLEEPSADGMIWRVDLRLRPEGSQGPVVNSLAAAERYYETWGRFWERAALLRARAVAGDLSLGAELRRDVVTPFVFRREVDPNLATAMAELVLRSRAELSAAPERDLKLGPGGIREAEFFVQSLQLIWGGREPTLRVSGTLAALERLRARGLVTHREAQSISQAYLLLRRVEHHVQWSSGIQTHLLPERADALGRLARGLGYGDGDALHADLERARSLVARRFHSLAPAAPRPLARHQALLGLLERDDPELHPAAEQTFGTPDVAEHLRALARRPDGLFGAVVRERHPELADLLLDAIAESADPEQAARYLRSFIGRFSSPLAYVSALAEDPRSLRRLLTVFGASAFVGEAVASRPDVADVVISGAGPPSDVRRVVEGELTAAFHAALAEPDALDLRERFVDALRRAKRRVMVEVAVADLAGELRTRDATKILSDLADEVLDRSVHFELRGDARGLAVIAVGKLGGRDIGYGSDLDVLFIYDATRADDPEETAARHVRHAQRILRLISDPSPAGPGYELDARLRPSGTHGLLVTSLASFARYHGVALGGDGDAEPGPSVQSSGAAWERQALLRARFCAGDREFGRHVIDVASVAAYERGAPPVEEMHRLRVRMQHELAREQPGRHDLKTGHGGLLDIEFATQWLQMRHGHDRRLRTTDTARALEALSALGYIPRSEYETLRDGYAFLRRLEQRIHVAAGTGTTVIDEQLPGLAQLARRMGMSDAAGTGAREALMARYLDVTRAVRRAYLSVLGLAEG